MVVNVSVDGGDQNRGRRVDNISVLKGTMLFKVVRTRQSLRFRRASSDDKKIREIICVGWEVAIGQS